MNIKAFAILLLTSCLAKTAAAGPVFGFLEPLDKPVAVPTSLASDIAKGFNVGDRACFADYDKTTPRNALEATEVKLGPAARTLLVKPKTPDEPGAAAACYCGAYSCRMWIYSVAGEETHRLLETGGVSLEILDRADKGAKRLFVSSGTAGHQEAWVYRWDGRQYRVLRQIAVSSGDMDKAVARFRAHAAD